jgi:hypothetical protein
MIYLASPFTHKDRHVEFLRFTQTLKAVYDLIKTDKMVFSPVVHCYPMHAFLGASGDYNYWMVWNWSMLRRCDKLWILCLNEWDTSKGIRGEIEYALINHIEISLLNPDSLTTVPYGL